jgi:hypothetical protein
MKAIVALQYGGPEVLRYEPVVGPISPLREAAAARAMVEDRRNCGKVILLPD